MITSEQTNRCIADQQIKNVAKLLNGKLIRRVFKDSSGNQWRALIVEYPDTLAVDGERGSDRPGVRGQEDEVRPAEVNVNSRFDEGLCDWP